VQQVRLHLAVADQALQEDADQPNKPALNVFVLSSLARPDAARNVPGHEIQRKLRGGRELIDDLFPQGGSEYG
jgi:hypothetical protein